MKKLAIAAFVLGSRPGSVQADQPNRPITTLTAPRAQIS